MSRKQLPYGDTQPDREFGSDYHGFTIPAEEDLSPYDQWRLYAWRRWSEPNDPRRCPAASDFEPGQCALFDGHPGLHELREDAA